MSSLNPYELAALASDAYHRGYNAFMPNLAGAGDGLGSASFVTEVAGGVVIASSKDLYENDVDVAADFYAIAYLINGEIVISYRGSDNLHSPLPFGLEYPTGGADGQDVWDMNDGVVVDQVELALDFYNHVRSLFPNETPITLTGHSLGGALAATVASVMHAEAVVFNNTSYKDVVANIIEQLNDPDPQMYAEMKERVYGGPAPWNFGPATITEVALENDVAGLFRDYTQDDLVDMGTGMLSWDAHSMAPLILALQARERYGDGAAWTQAANTVFTQLNNDTVAANLGFVGANGNSRSGVMKDQIASTLLPGSDNPFGSSAAYSLTNDMQDLGGAATSGVNMTSMAQLIVQYAALQAKNAISESSNNGFLTYDAGSSLLSVDYTEAKWTFDQYVAGFSGDARDFSNYLSDHKLDSTEITALAAFPNRFEYEFYSNAVGGWTGQIGFESAQYTVRAVGTGTMDTIIGTNGDEQILLGGGNDQVKANGGVNWIDGGEGDDKLIDDNAWSKFEIAKDGGRYYFALRDSGTDPRIHVLDNMELFRLNGVEFDATNILNVAPTGIGVQSIGGSTTAGLAQGTYGAGASIIDLCALDLNAYDAFTWQILGNAANLYDISSAGVITAKAAVTYDYATWRGAVGSLTYEQWQENLGDYAALADSKYCFTVEVTDSYGYSWLRDIALFLEPGAGSLVGTPNADNLVGGTGRTVIAGLGAADTISDPDWLVLDYSASNAGVKLARSSTTDRIFEGYGGHAQGDVVTLASTSVRYDIIGSSFKDEILYAYEVFSGGGDDVITGSNIVHAGDGYDTIYASGTSTNWIDFGTGGGELYLANYSQRYIVDMELGTYRQVTGVSTPYHNLTVTGDYDKLYGSNYDDEIRGSSRNDIIYGGGGPNDKIWGLGGDDRLEGSGTLYGGAGNDTLVLTGSGVAWGDEGADVLTATGNGGALVGGSGNDTLTASGQSVWLIGGAGADTMTGTGTSFLGYSTATTGVVLAAVNGAGTGSGGDAAGDVFSGIRNFEGTIYNDSFTLTMQQYSQLWAGGGNDTVVVRHTSSTSKAYGEAGNDHLTSLSSVGQTFGAEGNDTLIGGGVLDGGSGNDLIIGDNYNGDQIGGDGDDIIESGKGNDTINFGTGGFDTFIFRSGDGQDSLFGAESHDIVRLVGIAAFDSIQDVAAHMGFNYGSAYLEMGYKDDYPEVYGPDAAHEYIGSIRFFQQSISTVLSLDWQFA